MSMQINEERRNKLINVLSDVLSRLCERNDRFVINDERITRFHASRAPNITIESYLERIAKYSNCSEECFVLALIYIDRLIRKNGTFLVNSLNVHRLMITSIMLGAKFFDDQYFNNAYFGKVGGVSCKEINLLEIEFLFMINFNLFVETELFETYNQRLLSHAEPTLDANGSKDQAPGSNHSESKLQTPESSIVSEAREAPTAPAQSRREFASRAGVISSPSQATSENCTRPTQRAAASVVSRVRHYPTQRCTPPSPNFLQNAKRIHMKTH
jgi:hypothetical protein